MKAKHDFRSRNARVEEHARYVYVRAVMFQINLVVVDVAMEQNAVDATFVLPADLYQFIMTLSVITNHLRADILFRWRSARQSSKQPAELLPGTFLFYPLNYLLLRQIKHQQSQRFVFYKVVSLQRVEIFVVSNIRHSQIESALRIQSPQQTAI